VNTPIQCQLIHFGLFVVDQGIVVLERMKQQLPLVNFMKSDAALTICSLGGQKMMVAMFMQNLFSIQMATPATVKVHMRLLLGFAFAMVVLDCAQKLNS